MCVTFIFCHARFIRCLGADNMRFGISHSSELHAATTLASTEVPCKRLHALSAASKECRSCIKACSRKTVRPSFEVDSCHAEMKQHAMLAHGTDSYLLPCLGCVPTYGGLPGWIYV